MKQRIVDKAVFGARLSEAMAASDETTYSLADKLSLTPGTVSRYANGLMAPKIPTLFTMAKLLAVNPYWLMGYDEPKYIPSTVSDAIPFPEPTIAKDVVTFYPIGTVAAGYDEVAYEEYSNEPVEIPAHYLGGRPKTDFFVLTVHGSSMYPLYLDGDKVLVLKQDTLNRSGEIGVVLYEGENATLKKVEYVDGEDWMCMVPINPEYQPKEIRGADLEQCRVLGIPRLLIRELH